METSPRVGIDQWVRDGYIVGGDYPVCARCGALVPFGHHRTHDRFHGLLDALGALSEQAVAAVARGFEVLADVQP